MKFYCVLAISIMLESSASAAKVTKEHQRNRSGKSKIGKVRERNLGSGLSGKSTAAPTLNPTTSPTLVRLETNDFANLFFLVY